MKKFLLFFLLCTLSFGVSNAQLFQNIKLRVISITKSDPHAPQSNPDDVIIDIDNEEVVVTAEEEVGDVEIIIEGEDGIEYEEEYDLSEGDVVTIDIVDYD